MSQTKNESNGTVSVSFEKISLFMVLALFFSSVTLFFGPVSVGAEDQIKEKQIVDLNQSLKNIIEENQKLMKQNEQLSGELTQVKTDQMQYQARYNDLQRDHADLASNVKSLRNDNRRYSQEIKKLEENLSELEQRAKENVPAVEEVSMIKTSKDDVMLLASAKSSSVPSVADQQVIDKEDKTQDLLTKIDAFNEADDQLREDSARAHYNMGNIYYQKGEYELAAREYYQAVTLMPNDPDTHYNLAFVSGQFLGDFETALKHYKMYLYLNPHPADENFVKERILEAELHLKTIIDSQLDKDHP